MTTEKEELIKEAEFISAKSAVPIICRLGWHEWGKWIDLSEGTKSFFGIGLKPVLLQEKRCIYCNAVSRRLSEVKT